MYTLSKAEKETVIRWNMESRIACIDTADPAMIRKLDKLVGECPDAYRLISEDALYGAKRYEVAARYVRFGKPASAAQREVGKRSAHVLHVKPQATAT